MYITRNEFPEVEYPILHDCLYLISLTYPSLKSCYMDRKGELALTFDEHLTDEQIKDVLFELTEIEITPYSPAPIGPSAMELKYGTTHCYRDNESRTEVYSKDGWDYRRMN